MITAEDEFEECLDLARQLLSGSDEIADAWEANELCNRALRLRPRDAVAWLVKAQVQLELDDPVAALSAVEMALRRMPRSAEVHYLHAASLSQMGRYDDALRAITRAFQYAGIASQGDDQGLMEELFYEKAAILEALNRGDEAVATFEAGLSRYPDSDLLRSGLEPLRRQLLRRSWQVLDGGRS